MTTLTQADLSLFIGSETIYKHWLGRLYYTEGVKFLAEKGGAFWLIDAIVSYQTRKLLKDPQLQEFQIWQLTVNPDHKAVLVCLRDTKAEVLHQKIPFTDFPLEQIKLYLINKVLLLPSEY